MIGGLADEANQGAGGPDRNMVHSSQQSKHEKASDTSNVLTLRDLKVVSSHEQESSKKEFAMDLKQNEQNMAPSFRNPAQLTD